MLEALFNAVGAGEIPRDVARRRLDRFATMKMRFLGDRVLRDVAWKEAEQLGWDSTHTAEYIALTQLQADAFITLDDGLARDLEGTVETASVEVLL